MRQRAVKVAEDVIQSVKGLDVNQGSFIDIYLDNETAQLFDTLTDSKQQAALLQQNECEVCALGACLISTVKLYNKFTFTSNAFDHIFPDENDLFSRLIGDVFTPLQLVQIEQAFEEGNGFFGYNRGEDNIDAFGEGADPDEDGRWSSLGLNRQNPDVIAAVKKAISFGRHYPDPTSRLVAIMKNIKRNDGEFRPR